jgi:hypothetical protein
MAETTPHLLLGNRGCGNVVVECAFARAEKGNGRPAGRPWYAG